MNLQRRRRYGAAAWGVGLLVAVVWNGLEGSAGVNGIWFSPASQRTPYGSGLLPPSVEPHSTVQAPTGVVTEFDPVPALAEREVALAAFLATRDQLRIELATESRHSAENAEDSMVARPQVEATTRTLQEQQAIEDARHVADEAAAHAERRTLETHGTNE